MTKASLKLAARRAASALGRADALLQKDAAARAAATGGSVCDAIESVLIAVEASSLHAVTLQRLEALETAEAEERRANAPAPAPGRPALRV